MLTLVTPQDESRFSLPVLVGREGESGGQHFLEFSTVHVRNANTRSAYTHGAELFLAWCEPRRITELGAIQPLHVAGYIEQMQRDRSAPTVKQHLTCLRMLFDWLVTGQVIPSNPAHAVRGPQHSVTKGSTPVIGPGRHAICSIAMVVSTVVRLRDRALR